MLTPIWIIAICEILRSIVLIIDETRTQKHRDNIYSQFVHSLKETDREFVRNVLEEFEKQDKEEN